MDYRDELRLCLQQALLQERDSLPQPGTVTPIFRDKTRRPGSMSAMLGWTAPDGIDVPE